MASTPILPHSQDLAILSLLSVLCRRVVAGAGTYYIHYNCTEDGTVPTTSPPQTPEFGAIFLAGLNAEGAVLVGPLEPSWAIACNSAVRVGCGIRLLSRLS